MGSVRACGGDSTSARCETHANAGGNGRLKQRGTGSYARGVKGDAHLRPGCYVVEMPATTVGPKARPPRCSRLPAGLVAAIAEAGAAWRDDKYKVRRVRDVVRANQLPGVALFWNTHTPPLTVPPPLVFQFEPTTLDESEVALQALCDDVLTVAAAEEPDRRRPASCATSASPT